MDLLIHGHDYRLALLHQFQVACFSSMCVDYRDRHCARRIGVYVFTPRTDSCSFAILARFSCESIDHDYRFVAQHPRRYFWQYNIIEHLYDSLHYVRDDSYRYCLRGRKGRAKWELFCIDLTGRIAFSVNPSRSLRLPVAMAIANSEGRTVALQ